MKKIKNYLIYSLCALTVFAFAADAINLRVLSRNLNNVAKEVIAESAEIGEMLSAVRFSFPELTNDPQDLSQANIVSTANIKKSPWQNEALKSSIDLSYKLLEKNAQTAKVKIQGIGGINSKNLKFLSYVISKANAYSQEALNSTREYLEEVLAEENPDPEEVQALQKRIRVRSTLNSKLSAFEKKVTLTSYSRNVLRGLKNALVSGFEGSDFDEYFNPDNLILTDTGSGASQKTSLGYTQDRIDFMGSMIFSDISLAHSATQKTSDIQFSFVVEIDSEDLEDMKETTAEFLGYFSSDSDDARADMKEFVGDYADTFIEFINSFEDGDLID